MRSLELLPSMGSCGCGQKQSGRAGAASEPRCLNSLTIKSSIAVRCLVPDTQFHPGWPDCFLLIFATSGSRTKAAMNRFAPPYRPQTLPSLLTTLLPHRHLPLSPTAARPKMSRHRPQCDEGLLRRDRVSARADRSPAGPHPAPHQQPPVYSRHDSVRH
jgi:hypothetical protein